MKNNSTRLILLLLLVVFGTSCGRTVYRAKVYKSKKYIDSERRYHFWHKHGAKPRQHAGGYW